MAHAFTFDWPDVSRYSHPIHLLKKDIDDLLIKAEKRPCISFHHAHQCPFRTTVANIVGNWNDDFMLLVHDLDDLTHLKLVYGWKNGPAFFIDDKLWLDIVALNRATCFSLQSYNRADDLVNWASYISDTYTLNPNDDIDTLSEAFYRLGNFYHHHESSIKEHLGKKTLRLQRQLRRELRKQFPKKEEE